jgi:glycosyltransferase involved in cell wall biosynthesis
VRIAQLVPALHRGDAIGNNILALRDNFKADGVESRIFYLDADSDMVFEGSSVSDYQNWISTDDSAVTIYHYALPSILSRIFKEAPGKKILVYHNITPPEFLSGYPHLQHISRVGRNELNTLRYVPDIAVADSEYNRLELVEMGFSKTMELPIMLNFESYHQQRCPVTLNMFTGSNIVTFLFVGRITPNKCQHDIIRLYGFYKRYVNARCRLILVGKYQGFEKYLWECRKLINRMQLGDIYIPGRVSHSELLAFYSLADIFVSMSEHEGFGVPLLESMILNVPVMAYAAAAVPHTMGDAGIVFSNKSKWLELSELAHLVVTDTSLQTRIINSQQRRLRYFMPDRLNNIWGSILKEL